MMMMRFGLVISLGLCAINSAAVFSAFIPPPSNHADSNIFHLGLVQDPAGGAAALDRNLNPDLSLGLQARGSAPTPADLPPGQVQPDWSSPQNLNDEPANIDQSAGSQDGAATITGENPQYTNPAGSSAPPSSILIADFYQTTPVPDLKGGAAAAFLGVLEVIHQTAAKVVHGMSGVLNPSDEPGLSGEGDAAAATALSLSGDLSLDETEERKIWCPNTRFQGRQLAVCDNGNPRSIWFHVGLDVIMVNEAYLYHGPGTCVGSLQQYWCCEDWALRWANTGYDCWASDDWAVPGPAPSWPSYKPPKGFGQTWPLWPYSKFP